MPYLNVGDSKLYYEDHGHGQPLVLLHGVGGNHASWFHQVAEWHERYRVIVPDARGFGNSTDAEGLGREAFVEDLTCLLNALDISSAVLVGQSMGGGTAVQMAKSKPDRVDALVLADTLFGLTLPERIREFMHTLNERTIGLSQLERVLSPRFSSAHPEMARLYVMLASFNSVNIHTLKGAQATVTPRDLAATNVPVLYIVGEEDVLFPPEAVKCVNEDTPGSRLVVMPRAGHSAYFEQPQEFNLHVERWLAEVSRAATYEKP